jgi:flagellar hook assembly protein FlgD
MDSILNSYTAFSNTANRRAVASETERSGAAIDAVYADKGDNGVSVEDFLQLMITQLSNQDFLNPTDNSQFLSQMAQFSSMQQMQALAGYSKSNYTMSLLGKEVTLTKMSIGGHASQISGIVEKVSLDNNDFKIYVNGMSYDLDQIVSAKPGKDPSADMPEAFAKAVANALSSDGTDSDSDAAGGV